MGVAYVTLQDHKVTSAMLLLAFVSRMLDPCGWVPFSIMKEKRFAFLKPME